MSLEEVDSVVRAIEDFFDGIRLTKGHAAI
jgi:hypothetical protein